MSAAIKNDVDSSTTTPSSPLNIPAADGVINGAKARYLYSLNAQNITIDGTGEKIGIISDSFNLPLTGNPDPADAAAQEGYLPQASNGNSAVTVIPGLEGKTGGDEGLAMAELVHATAPGAQIYFASPYSTVSASGTYAGYVKALNALESVGCNIIVDDIGLFAEPFFSNVDSINSNINNYVSDPKDNYFTASGNDGSNYYQSTFSPISVSIPSISPSPVLAMNFGGGRYFESVTVLPISINHPFTLNVDLQWQSSFDGQFTLYLFNSSGQMLTSSGKADNYNFQYISVPVPVSSVSQIYEIFITGPANVYIPPSELFRVDFVGSGTRLTISDPNAGVGAGEAGDAFGHEALSDVNRVGAVNVATPSEIEGFSEVANVSFVAPDGGATTVIDPFKGTSAAAPVAAAVAALMLQEDPSLTNSQVTNYLEKSTIAVNAPLENAGTGLIQADTALGLVEGNFQVSTEQEFDEAINAINQDSAVQNRSYTITLQSSLGLANPVPTLLLGNSADLTIKGSGQTINLGGSALNFSQGPITIDSANLFNGGTISIAGQDLDLVDSSLYVSAIASSGAFDIQPTSTLAVTGVIASGSTIDFSGTGGTLQLSDPAGVAGAISDFLQGDTIDLAGVGLASDALLGDDNVLYVNGALEPIALQLDSGQDYSNDGFVVASDGNGGTDITVQPNTHDTNSPDGTSTTTTNDPSGTYTDSTTYSGPNGTGTALSRTITFYASNAVYQGGANPPTGEFPNVDLTETPNLIIDIETKTGVGYFGVNLVNMGIQSSIGVIAPNTGYTGEGFYSEYAGQIDWDNVPTTGSGIVFLPIGAITDAPIAEVGGNFTKTGSGNDESASGDYFLQTGLFSNESASSYSVSNVSATESPTGVGSITFTINRSGSSATAGIPLYYKIVSENRAGKSFNEPLQTPVTFLAGEMSRTITTDFLPITFQVSTGDMIGISVPVYAEYPVDYYPIGVPGTLFNYNDTETSELAQIAPACYFVGTALATFAGNRPVETLAIGDLMLTASGQLRPIKWIGRRGYMSRFVAGWPALWPIRFQAGSLGGGLPRRDLWVSGEHAMFLDDLLIPARQLVNGTTITRDRPQGDLMYFHIELETHDVILAEGAAAETFLDDDSRQIFHNAAEFAALYPDAGPPGRFCAPRVESGYELEAVRCRLNALAGERRQAA